MLSKAISAYRNFLKPFGGGFLEPFRNHFETVPECFLTVSGNRSETLSNSQAKAGEDSEKVSNNININSNNNLHTHNNEGYPAAPLSWHVVAAHAAEHGWPNASQRRVENLLAGTPAITWDDFARLSAAIQGRQDVHDPLSYLFGIARRTVSEGGSANAEAPVQDGQELNFDD